MKRIALVLISSSALAAAFVPAAFAQQTATMKINSISPTGLQVGNANPYTGDVEGGVGFSPTHVFVSGSDLGSFLRTDYSVGSTVFGQSWGDSIGADTCRQKTYTLNWDGTSGPVSVTTLTQLDPTTGDATGADITLSPPLNVTLYDGGEKSAIFSGCGRLLVLDGDNGKVYDIDLPSGATSLATTIDINTSPYISGSYLSESDIETGVVENFGGNLWIDYPVEGDGTSGDPGTLQRMKLSDSTTQTVFTVPEGTGTDGYHYEWGDNPTFNVDAITGTWFLNYEYGDENDWISGQDSNASGYDEVLVSFDADVTYSLSKPASKPSLAKKGTAGGTSARVKLGCGGSGKCKIELSGKLKGGSGKVVAQTVKVKAGKKATVEVRYTQTLIDELNSRGGGKIKLTAKQVGGKSSSIVLVVPSSVTG